MVYGSLQVGQKWWLLKGLTERMRRTTHSQQKTWPVGRFPFVKTDMRQQNIMRRDSPQGNTAGSFKSLRQTIQVGIECEWWDPNV